MSGQDLIQASTLLADLGEEPAEAYAWRKPCELLTLRPLRSRGWLWNKPPFVAFTQFIHTYELDSLDVNDGAWRPMSVFNRKYRKQLVGTPMHMVYLGADGEEDAPREIRYVPPSTYLSPDGEWLLWRNRLGRWIAADPEGVSERSWRGSSGYSQHAVWLRTSRRWIEMVQAYVDDSWVIPRLVLRKLDEPSYERTVEADGLDDGLLTGLTERDTILLRHPAGGG